MEVVGMVYIGTAQLPIREELKKHLSWLLERFVLLRAQQGMLVTHVSLSDRYLVRMAIVLDGVDARYAEASHVDLEKAFQLAAASLETQLEREVLYAHWHEDALAAE